MSSGNPDRLLLDTVMFNRVLDGRLDLSDFGGCDFFATHIQLDELANTTNQDRKLKLLNIFNCISPYVWKTDSFVLDVSRLNCAMLNVDGTMYNRILSALKLKEKDRDFGNQERDALVAETALKNEFILATDDCNLSCVVRQFGGATISSREFASRYRQRT